MGVTLDKDERGVDYDLSACLIYNEQAGFAESDIAKVLAVVPGENDAAPWYWLLSLQNGQYAALEGWCDYTGWDCQSDALSAVFPTVERALDWFAWRRLDPRYPDRTD